MNKDAWLKLAQPISIKEFPPLPCPSCVGGELILDQSSLTFRPSKEQYKQDNFWKDDFEQHVLLGILVAVAATLEQMQWKQSRFVGYIVCSTCKENTVITGRAEVPSDVQKVIYKKHILPGAAALGKRLARPVCQTPSVTRRMFLPRPSRG